MPLLSPTVFEGTVSICSPKTTKESLINLVTPWIQKQGKHWPSEITASVIIDNISLIYFAHWVVSGQGEASWSGSVGVYHQVPDRCNRCNGRGYYTPFYETKEQRCPDCGGTGRGFRQEIFWNSQSGYVNAEVTGRLTQNYDGELHCGSRDVTAPAKPFDKASVTSYTVYQPQNTTGLDGIDRARVEVIEQLQTDANIMAGRMGDRVRDLVLANIQVTGLKARTWLYPIWLGTYQYDDEELIIQVDGITGEVWADIPKAVKDLRNQEFWGKAAFITIVVIIVIVALLTSHR